MKIICSMKLDSENKKIRENANSYLFYYIFFYYILFYLNNVHVEVRISKYNTFLYL